jgi:phage protein U
MAVIGSLGSLVFQVSSKQIATFDNAKWDLSARYSEHTRHLRDPLVEFTGLDNDKFSFTMNFNIWLGVDPLKQVIKVVNMERRGEVNRLIIGTKIYGRNKWVITGVSNTLKEFDNKGKILVASVDVSLLAYPGR